MLLLLVVYCFRRSTWQRVRYFHVLFLLRRLLLATMWRISTCCTSYYHRYTARTALLDTLLLYTFHTLLLRENYCSYFCTTRILTTASDILLSTFMLNISKYFKVYKCMCGKGNWRTLYLPNFFHCLISKTLCSIPFLDCKAFLAYRYNQIRNLSLYLRKI